MLKRNPQLRFKIKDPNQKTAPSTPQGSNSFVFNFKEQQ